MPGQEVLQLPVLRRHLLGLSLCALVPLAHAVDITFEPVAPGVYAFVGEKGGRTHQNEGLNANIGLVVTPAGALLIDSGASFKGAQQIHAAVQQVTDQPVKWVINTGGQDHRWLGNGYFAAQGAEVMAHADAKADLLARGGDHISGLKTELKDKLDGTVPTLPTRWLRAPDETLRLPDTVVEIRHRGGAHTPGDLLVSQSFLVSQATLQRRQQLSVLMTARRGTFTVSYARGQSSRLLNNLTLGDDFDSTSRIKTDTLSFLYAHRLTPVTSANASYAIQRSEGDLDTQRNSQYTLTLGISTQLGRRTSGSVQVRRLHSTSGLNPYSENALVGNILHRF